MPRVAFPSRVDVRRNVGFQAAMARLTAAKSWSSLINEQIELARQLTTLVTEAPARLRARDKTSQRGDWARRVADLNARASVLAARPVTLESDVATTHASADATERRTDPISEGLRDVASRLPAILEGNLAGTAALLRGSRTKLIAARDAGDLVLGFGAGFARPVSDELLDGIERLARVLLVVQRDSGAAQHIDTRDLVSTVDGIVTNAGDSDAADQLAILKSVVDGIPNVGIHHVIDPKPFPNAILDRAWLLTVQIDAWNALVEALRTLTHDQRWAIAANVLAATMDGDEVVPLAIRIAHTGDTPEFPITAEILRPFVESAELRLRPGSVDTHTVLSEVVDALTTLSWEVSCKRARPIDWPDIAGAPTRSLDDLLMLAQTGIDQLPPDVRETATGAIEVLVSQVQAELSTPNSPDRPVTLAGEMFENSLADSHEGPAEHLWVALSVISGVIALG